MSADAAESTCVLFALHWEARPFLRFWPPRAGLRGAPCTAHICRHANTEALVLETGMGAVCVRRALDWLFGSSLRAPRRVLSAGFSGALSDHLEVGHVIVATEIVDSEDHIWPVTWQPTCAQGVHSGRLLSFPELVCTAAEKMRLRQQFDAVVVDMETAVIAGACQTRGVPFGSVRAVSDSANARLRPATVSLLKGSGVSTSRVIWSCLRSPLLALDLWRLAADARVAATSLARVLTEVLVQL